MHVLDPYVSSRFGEIRGIIRNTATTYQDPTHPLLSYEELEAEGLAKVAQVLNGTSWLSLKDKPRPEFFKYIKTAINNHIKSMVVRYRLTAKRGYDAINHKKNVDASVDDAEFGVDIASPLARESVSIEDMKAILDPVEYLVLNQRINPNDAAVVLAYMDSRGSMDRVHISTEHQASGLGLPVGLYVKKLASATQKFKEYMTDPTQDNEFWSHVRALEDAFKLQVPPSLEKIIVRRLMTIAARDQYALVTPSVTEHLRAIQVPVPKLDPSTDKLACFGALYRSDHRACAVCTLNSACSIETQNVGLGKIAISTQLMPQGHQRCATGDGFAANDVLARAESVSDLGMPERLAPPSIQDPGLDQAQHPADAAIESESMLTSQLLSYLTGKLGSSKSGSTLYLFIRHDRKPVYIFNYVGAVRRIPGCVPIRLCAPCQSVQDRLTKAHGGYYISDTLSYDDAVSIMEDHINDRGAQG